MPRRSELEWRQIVERQRDSGLTDKEFAEHEGFSVASLRGWRYRLQRQGGGSGDLVEVQGFSRRAEVSVRLPNGMLVEIRSDWDQSGLADFVSRMKAL
ncbi:MAG: IS66 family insertion sequence element accessory protein TnpA [Candidatus Micrarchaeaceae archaeon]